MLAQARGLTTDAYDFAAPQSMAATHADGGVNSWWAEGNIGVPEFTDTATYGQAGIGWINDKDWPTIFCYTDAATAAPSNYTTGGYWLWIDRASGNRFDGFYAYRWGGDYYIWAEPNSGWYYSYQAGNEGWFPFVLQPW
ncbi:MAG: hypothetical protein Q7P63_02365 [Verrucomicrobiota bacterium JB022]|nr:hypothetical protein [Verrucomicrobiota bacterium JB022]